MAVCLIFAALLTTTLAGNCNNPLYDDPFPLGDRDSVPMSLLAEPLVQSDLSPCTAYNGKAACCSPDTFAPFLDYYRGYDANVDFVMSVLSEITPEQLAAILINDKGWNFNDIQKGALINLIALMMPLIPSGLVCQGGMIGYQQGMICFSCDPDWAQYYNTQTNVLSVNPNTCDSVWADCSPLLNSINNVAVQAVGYVITIYNNTANASAEYINDLIHFQALVKASGSVCPVLGYKDCKSLICNGTLHGIEIGINFTEFQEPHSTHYELQSKSKKYSPETKALMGLFTSFLHNNEKIQNVLPKRNLLQIKQGVQNVYPTTGNSYDAYAVGCSDAISKYACPSPSPYSNDDGPSTAWIIAVTFGVLLGVCILGFAIFLALKFRHRGPRSLQDHKEPLAVQAPSDLDYLPPSAPEPREQTKTSDQQ